MTPKWRALENMSAWSRKGAQFRGFIYLGGNWTFVVREGISSQYSPLSMWAEYIYTKSRLKALFLYKFVKELAAGWRGGGGGGLITRGTGHNSSRIPPGIVHTIVSKSGNFKSWITNSNGPLTASFKCKLIYPKITFFYFKRKDIPTLSQQQQIVKDGTVPFPLYTCLHVKKDVSAQKFCGEI